MLKTSFFALFLLGVSTFSYAGDLPSTLNGSTFIFQVVGNYNPKTNPNAFQVYRMSFTKSNYSYVVLSSNQHYSGKYTYQRKNVNGVSVGVIRLGESDAGQPTNYTMTLVGDNHSGYYIYKQATGAIKPNVRMNVAKYYLVDLHTKKKLTH